MSRQDGRAVKVCCGAGGQPISVLLSGERLPIDVTAVRDYWREWFNIVQGEPERDVWQVETGRGLLELHHVLPPLGTAMSAAVDDTGDTNDKWFLARWED